MKLSDIVLNIALGYNEKKKKNLLKNRTVKAL